MFSVPLTSMTGYTEYLYPPPGTVVPLIEYIGNTNISNITFSFKTMDDIPMVWLKGSRIQVIFELEQEL